ncbi:GMC oxidoreductase [Sporormia fimetaria CBS 119925]|uniref:GMC oxidoreductase n=1 Tax=Sporormia fimetaria CBS 119925 TaxID=1340428 RepID=A0A6A6V5E0_9PLEO|nr:GMC oxidoreductase [Sporormia fimetaria CBS 119925]
MECNIAQNKSVHRFALTTSFVPTTRRTNDAEIEEALKRALQPTNAHECCTALMMTRDKGGVVGPDLRVYGVRKLSVVDASVWPIIPGGGPQASVYGTAEKAAEIIKRRHVL